MSYFKRVEKTDAPGEYDYVEVADTELEVPDELVLKNPLYKKVADSDFKRRNRIKELKAELDKAGAENQDEAVEPETVVEKGKQSGETVVQPEPLDEEKLYTNFKARLAQEQAEANKAANDFSMRIRDLAKNNGLGADALPLLAEAKDPAAMAEMLAKSSYRFDDTVGGAPDDAGKEALLGKVLDNLGLGDPKK